MMAISLFLSLSTQKVVVGIFPSVMPVVATFLKSKSIVSARTNSKVNTSGISILDSTFIWLESGVNGWVAVD